MQMKQMEEKGKKADATTAKHHNSSELMEITVCQQD